MSADVLGGQCACACPILLSVVVPSELHDVEGQCLAMRRSLLCCRALRCHRRRIVPQRSGCRDKLARAWCSAYRFTCCRIYRLQ